MHLRAAAGSRADAVERLLAALTPAAVLLDDDPDRAVELLAAALGAPRSLDHLGNARRALARQVLDRPRWSAEQVIETTGQPAPADDDVALAAALRALSGRQRAAAVLHLTASDGNPSPEADAALAQLRRELAARDAEERRERARVASLYRAPGTAPPGEQPAIGLPERLARLAAGRPLPPTAAGSIAAAISEIRGRRRRRRWQVAAGAVAAGVLVLLTSLLPQGTRTSPTVYGGPTRGTLAGDGDFLATMAKAAWPGARGQADSPRVVFADDVPGGRWALVAEGGTPSRPAAIAWFTGPSGASPEQMTVSWFRTAPDPSLPVSLTDPTTGALAVVAAPGDRIAVSARPEVGADGSVSRSYRQVQAPRGVAVAGLTPVPDATVSAARLRVARDHRRLDVPPPAVLAGPAAPDGDVPVVALRPATPSVLGDSAVETRLRAVLGQLGEVATTTPVTALWSGDLPGPTRLSVLAVEQPSGAFVVTAPYTYAARPGGRDVRSWCGTGVLPAGMPLDQRVVAVRCDVRDRTIRAEISRFLVVVGPRAAVEVRLLDADGAELSAHALDDGVAVIRSPGDVAEVAVATAGGGTTAARPLVDSDLAG